MLVVVMWMVVFLIAIPSGLLWSKRQRRKAVEEAYEAIREEVRAERRGDTPSTITIWSFKRL